MAPGEAGTAGDRKIQTDAPVGEVSFSSDGKTLAGVCADGNLRVWDVRAGSLLRTLSLSRDIRGRTQLWRGASIVAGPVEDGSVRLWNANSGVLLHTVVGHEHRPSALAISPDGSVVASSNARERIVRVWELPSGRQKFKLPDGVGGAARLVFSPNGSVLVGSNYDTDLRVWDVRTGELLRKIDELLVSMFAMSFSPDGAYLATAGADQVVYLWDAKNWTVLRKFVGQPETITAMSFSPDGRLLITGGADARSNNFPAKVIIWDVASGKAIRTLPATRSVASVVFSPDSTLAVSTESTKTLNFWAVPGFAAN